MNKGGIMINILFGGNDKVFDGILLCVLSMTKHCQQPLNVFVLTANVSELNADYIPIEEKQIEILRQVLKSKNPKSEVNLINLKKNFNDWICASSNKLNTYTPFAFLRLFADKIEELPEKIIYLDTDIMLNGDITELFDIDLKDSELAVVHDRYGRIFIKPTYFNSGMLLMNLKKIRETQLLEKVREVCAKKKMAFPDQSALNKLCKKKIYLPRKFNEQGRLRNNTIIQHFSKRIVWLPYFHTINIKPWQTEQVRKKYKINTYDDIYEQFEEIKSLKVD